MFYSLSISDKIKLMKFVNMIRKIVFSFSTFFLVAILMGCSFKQAETFNVIFYNAHNEVIGEIQKIEKYKDAVEPNEEERKMDNYVFYGWDRTFTSVEHDLNIYGLYYSIAKINDNWLTVIFDYNINSFKEEIYIKNNTLIPEINVKPIEGKTLDFWCIDKDCTTPWDFEHSKAVESMTLYAKWK